MALSWHFHGKSKHAQRGKCQESARKVPWKRHESAMKVPWICHASAMKLFGKTIKIRRKKAPWKCHERAMKPTWIWHDFDFLGLKETETVQAHVMLALYPKNYFQIVMSVLSCLCLPFLIFSLVIFQIYQSFCVFLWSKYRVIRNTQTTNPNPQLSLTWGKLVENNCSCCFLWHFSPIIYSKPRVCVCALCVPTCRNQSLFSTQDKKSRRAVRTARGIFGSFSWLRTSSNWNASLVARLWLSSGSSKRCQKTTWFSLSFGSLVGLLTSTKTAVSKYNREGLYLTPGCNFSSKVSKTARACKQLSKCQFSKWDMSFCEVPASPGPIVNSSIPWRALFISRSSASHALSCCIAIAVVAAMALYESGPTSRPNFNALRLQATITANGMEGAGFASGTFAECTSATLAQCISINEAADKDALASAFPLFKSSLLRSSTRFHCSAARCSRWHSTLVKAGRTASCEALRSRRAIRTCANNIKAKSRVTKLSAIFPRHCTSRRPSSRCASSHSFTAKMLRSVSENVASPWPNQSHPLAICPEHSSQAIDLCDLAFGWLWGCSIPSNCLPKQFQVLWRLQKAWNHQHFSKRTLYTEILKGKALEWSQTSRNGSSQDK